MDIVIYHNPACGTSRNALALIRHVGIEPHVIEYLKTPPSRKMVAELAARTGQPLRTLLREKGTPYADLGLGYDAITDEQLLDAVWGSDVYVEARTVDVHVGRLRKALSVEGTANPIRTVRSAGYSLDLDG